VINELGLSGEADRRGEVPGEGAASPSPQPRRFGGVVSSPAGFRRRKVLLHVEAPDGLS